MTVVSLQYSCEACGETVWEESPLVPLRRFMPHYCPNMSSHTVMTAHVPDSVEQLIAPTQQHYD